MEAGNKEVASDDATETVSVVSCHALRHSYRGGVEALRGVSMDAKSGECVAVVGPNGSGKTTLFSILSTRLRPGVAGGGVGDARLGGVVPWEQPNEARRRLGVVFQHPSVDGKLKAEENLRCQARLYGFSGAALRDAVRDALQAAGLTERGGEFVERFSGGMKRRLEIAKAMMHGPAVLLLDEPDAGLDPRALREVWDQLDALRADRRTAVLIATHRMELAERCDRVAVLSRGVVRAFGSPAGLRASLPDGVLRVEADSEHTAALADGITALREAWADGAAPRVRDGVVTAYDDRAAALAAEVHARWAGRVTRVSFGRATLEDVFFALTGERASDSESAAV